MILVTGGAGFIGSNLVHALNAAGHTDLVLVDSFAPNSSSSPSPKFLNLTGARFTDFLDKSEFEEVLRAGHLRGTRIQAILHQGACSNTLEPDGRYMMRNNFSFSKLLLQHALSHSVPFIYASTAAVYGQSSSFTPDPQNERPLNLYAFSKLTFDNYVRHLLPGVTSTVVGLRYFNAYGPREAHKGRMSSVIHQFNRQLLATGVIQIFGGSGGYASGEQRRDFVHVDDLTRVNLHFAHLLPHTPTRSTQSIQAIVNVGTGIARTFNDVAQTLIHHHGAGRIEYIPMPADLHAAYQSCTQADLHTLRAAGYTQTFLPLEAGIHKTLSADPHPGPQKLAPSAAVASR